MLQADKDWRARQAPAPRHQPRQIAGPLGLWHPQACSRGSWDHGRGNRGMSGARFSEILWQLLAAIGSYWQLLAAVNMQPSSTLSVIGSYFTRESIHHPVTGLKFRSQVSRRSLPRVPRRLVFYELRHVQHSKPLYTT